MVVDLKLKIEVIKKEGGIKNIGNRGGFKQEGIKNMWCKNIVPLKTLLCHHCLWKNGKRLSLHSQSNSALTYLSQITFGKLGSKS